MPIMLQLRQKSWPCFWLSYFGLNRSTNDQDITHSCHKSHLEGISNMFQVQVKGVRSALLVDKVVKAGDEFIALEKFIDLSIVVLALKALENIIVDDVHVASSGSVVEGVIVGEGFQRFL